MDDRSIRRELRLLKGYAIASTLLFATFSLTAFHRNARERFTEIDVERINIVEPDGKYRMILSNRPRSPAPIYKGEPFGYAGGGRPGIIFFNDEGTENGGLTFVGKVGADGKVNASTHMSFDQFNQDQVLNLDYTENDGQRLVGISMLDRAAVNIHDFVLARDSINKMADTVARNAAMQRLVTPPGPDPFAARRVFLGRNSTKTALLALSDRAGKTRIRLAVDSAGVASLEFLDEAGKVTARFPEK